VLKKKGSSVRDKILLSSKVGCPTESGKGLAKDRILQQINVTLSRLGTDYLDMYLIHEPDPITPVEETLVALNELIKAGKVKHIGASNMTFPQVMEADEAAGKNNLRRFEWIQNGYSLLERKDEGEIIPYCIENGVGYTPFSPLAGGWLTGKYRQGSGFPDDSRMVNRPGAYLGYLEGDIFERIEKFRSFCKGQNHTMGAVALVWNIHQPGVTAPLAGPKKVSHLNLAEEALNISLTGAEVKEITSIFNLS
jgi:aryl-alcohol dehydrogenase-like predicted oxidoreductase